MSSRSPEERIAYLEGQHKSFVDEVKDDIRALRERDDVTQRQLVEQTRELVGEMRKGNHALRDELHAMGLSVAKTEKAITIEIARVKEDLTAEITEIRGEQTQWKSNIGVVRWLLGGMFAAGVSLWAGIRDLDWSRFFK